MCLFKLLQSKVFLQIMSEERKEADKLVQWAEAGAEPGGLFDLRPTWRERRSSFTLSINLHTYLSCSSDVPTHN